jgi:hypothetical protein
LFDTKEALSGEEPWASQYLSCWRSEEVEGMGWYLQELRPDSILCGILVLFVFVETAHD